MQRATIWRPWASALESRSFGIAAVLLIMQLSLVLWPAAARIANRQVLERQMQDCLDQLAASYAIPKIRGNAEPAESFGRMERV